MNTISELRRELFRELDNILQNGPGANPQGVVDVICELIDEKLRVMFSGYLVQGLQCGSNVSSAFPTLRLSPPDTSDTPS